MRIVEGDICRPGSQRRPISDTVQTSSRDHLITRPSVVSINHKEKKKKKGKKRDRGENTGCNTDPWLRKGTRESEKDKNKRGGKDGG